MPETFSFVTHSSSSASPAPSPRHKHSPLSPAATQLNPNFFKVHSSPPPPLTLKPCASLGERDPPSPLWPSFADEQDRDASLCYLSPPFAPSLQMHDPTSSKQAVTNCPDCGRSVLHSAFIQHAGSPRFPFGEPSPERGVPVQRSDADHRPFLTRRNLAQCQRPRARSPSQQPSASDQPVEDSGSLQKKRRFSDGESLVGSRTPILPDDAACLVSISPRAPSDAVSLSTASPPPTNKKSRPSPAPSASIAGSDVGGGPGEGKKEKKEAKKKKTEPVLSGKG